MKNKKMKQILSLVLASSMLLVSTACGQTENKESSNVNSQTEVSTSESSSEVEKDEFAWLHPGQVPIVEEGTEKTLSVYLSTTGEKPVEDRWCFQFIEEALNINLEVTTLTSQNRSEQVALAFASGEMPDLFLVDLDTAALLKYGNAGQIVDLAPYINEKFAPNLTKIYNEYPAAKKAVTDTDGHVWSIGRIETEYPLTSIGKTYINYNWLDQVDKEAPKTLDELTEVLRAFKTLGDDIVPLGGAFGNHTSPMSIILQACGYVHSMGGVTRTGVGIAVKDGEAVLPVRDREVFAEVIKYTKMLYDEGLVHPEFFTMDATTATALLAEGKVGVWTAMPYSTVGDTYADWWGLQPLTSKYNDTPKTAVAKNQIRAGGAVISSNCKDVELAVAFIDYFYNLTDNVLESNIKEFLAGPREGVDYGFESDATLRVLQKDGSYAREDFGKWTNDNEYKNNELVFSFTLGMNLASDYKTSLGSDTPKIEEIVSQFENPEDAYLYDGWTSGKIHDQAAMYVTNLPYATEDTFPTYYYLDGDTSKKMADILAAVKEYATVEFARFVTGARPLTDAELTDFFDTVDRLGAEEYEKVHADYYNSIK